MKARNHILVSACLAGGLYYALRSPAMAIATLAGGVLIDMDHAIDFALGRRPRPFSISGFFDYFYNDRFERVYIFLHGWEWLALWAVAAYATGWSPWAVGFLIGQGLHLALDQATNKARPAGYFLLARALRGFSREAFFRKDRKER